MASDFELGYPPNDMEINKVAVKLSVALNNDMMKWSDFGMNLLETTDKEKLTLIEQKCEGKQFKYKCQVLLETWKAKTSDPKWEQVIAALRETDDELEGLATKLEKALKAKQQVGTTLTSVDGRSHQDTNQGQAGNQPSNAAGQTAKNQPPGTSTPASKLAAEPTLRELKIIVVPEVKAEWRSLAISMEYKGSEISTIKKDHDGVEEQCIKLFDDWLETSNGCTPKTWETLLERIKEVPKLFASEGRIRKKLLDQ